MFQFPRFPLSVLCVQTGVTPHDGCRVSPFGHPRIEAWSAAPRGFSQPPTSFLGFRRQGIHRWLFVAWRTKMLVLAMEFSRGARCHRCRSTAGRSARAVNQRGRLPTSRKQRHVQTVAPSKRNSEVRRSHEPGIRGRPGPLPRKETSRTRRPPSMYGRRITSDRLGVLDRNGRDVDSLERR